MKDARAAGFREPMRGFRALLKGQCVVRSIRSFQSVRMRTFCLLRIEMTGAALAVPFVRKAALRSRRDQHAKSLGHHFRSNFSNAATCSHADRLIPTLRASASIRASSSLSMRMLTTALLLLDGAGLAAAPMKASAVFSTSFGEGILIAIV
jgi:hypothetical protein